MDPASRHEGAYPIIPFRSSEMRMQLRHVSLVPSGSSDLLLGMAALGLLLLAFLAYTVAHKENVPLILVRRKKEKADDDLRFATDPFAKKDIDLESGKRRQYVVEDLYRFKTVTSPSDEGIRGIGYR
jgi:hypothetical protein